jgi:hypothetical protein
LIAKSRHDWSESSADGREVELMVVKAHLSVPNVDLTDHSNPQCDHANQKLTMPNVSKADHANQKS